MDVRGLVALTLSSVVASTLMSAVHNAMSVLLALVLVERVYDAAQDRDAWHRVLCHVDDRAVFWCRRAAQAGRMRVAGLVVGPWLRWAAAVDDTMSHSSSGGGSDGGSGGRVRVHTWRWAPPIVPDATEGGASADADTNTLVVLRELGKGYSGDHLYSAVRETTVPSDVPEAVQARVEHVVRRMQSAHVEARSCSRVLLLGPPGCGKTTSSRALARALGAVLCPTFDPTRPGYNLRTLSEYARAAQGGEDRKANSNAPIVIVMEEVETCMQRLMPGLLPREPAMRDDDGGDDGGGGLRVGRAMQLPDRKASVVDKASWNNMLDALRFMPDTCVIMTSNLTEAQLRALDAPHGGALLRDGRITAVIDMHADSMGDAADTIAPTSEVRAPKSLWKRALSTTSTKA